MSINRKLLKLLGLFSILTLVGCSSTSNNTVPFEESVKQKGALVATLFDHSTHGNITGLTLKQEKSSKSIKLAVKSSFGRIQMVSGFVLPGIYEVSEINGYAFTNSFDINALGLLPKITVSKGKATDIGHIISQPIENADHLLITAPRDKSLDTLVKNSAFLSKFEESEWVVAKNWKDFHQKQKASTDFNSSGGLIVGSIINYGVKKAYASKSESWRDISNAEQALSKAKSSSIGLSMLTEKDGMELIAGSSLGQILYRLKSGQWKRLDTGLISAVVAVDSIEDYWLAISETGEIIEKTDGKNWIHATYLEPTQSLRGLFCLKKNSCLIVTQEVSESVIARVFMYQENEMSLVFEYSGSSGNALVNRMWAQPFVFQNTMIIALPRNKIAYLDLSNFNSKVETTKQNFDQVIYGSNGTALVFEILGPPAFRDSYIYNYINSSWVEANIPSNAWGHTVLSKEQMFSIKDEYIRKSSDGGNKWSKYKKLPKDCSLISTSSKNKIFICQDKQGNIAEYPIL